MNSKKVEENIYDIVYNCSYSKNYLSNIATQAFDIYKSYPSTEFYKTSLQKQKGLENFLMLRFHSTIKFESKDHEIPLLCYIPKSFPFSAPEVFVEKNTNIIINTSCNYIGQSNGKIIVSSIQAWSSSSNILKVIHEINGKFSEACPFTLLSDHKNAFVNISNLNLTTKDIKTAHTNLKSNLENTLIRSLQKGINSELMILREDYLTLNVSKDKFTAALETLTKIADPTKMKEVVEHIDETLTSKMESLKLDNLLMQNKTFCLEDVEEFLIVKNPKKMKFVANMKYREELISVVKKGYEMSKFDFDEGVKQIRKQSIFIFKIGFIINKMN